MKKLILAALLAATTVSANPNEYTVLVGSVVCTSKDALNLSYKILDATDGCVVLKHTTKVALLNASWIGDAEIYFKGQRFFTSSSTVRKD